MKWGKNESRLWFAAFMNLMLAYRLKKKKVVSRCRFYRFCFRACRLSDAAYRCWFRGASFGCRLSWSYQLVFGNANLSVRVGEVLKLFTRWIYPCTVGQINQKPRRKYWATRLLVRSHCSFVRLLHLAHFVRAVSCAHSFARSLTLLTPLLNVVGHWMIEWLFILCFFFSILDHSAIDTPT